MDVDDKLFLPINVDVEAVPLRHHPHPPIRGSQFPVRLATGRIRLGIEVE